MSTVIQTHYDQLDLIGKRFGSNCREVAEVRVQLRQRVSSLADAGWEGQGAVSFFNEMDERILPAVDRLIRALAAAQVSTLRIARILREAEEEAARLFEGRGDGSWLDEAVGALSGGLLNSPSGSSGNSWLDKAADALGAYLDILGLGGTRTRLRNFLRDIGRAYNELFDTKGGVKAMDELYDRIKVGIPHGGKKLARLLGDFKTGTALDFGLNFIGGEDYSGRGLAVAAVETAITAGAVFLIAGGLVAAGVVTVKVAAAAAVVGAVYGIYTISHMVASNLGPAMLDAVGLEGMADVARKYYDFIDINQHIRDGSEWIVDNAPKAWEAAKDGVGKAVDFVGDFLPI